MTSGTLGCMRKALELETTAQPAAAKRGSISRAMSASRAAKMIFGAPSGSAGEIVILAMRSGQGVSRRHLAASSYFLPLERSLAASQVIWNQGGFPEAE
jgi:hypothetical protein